MSPANPSAAVGTAPVAAPAGNSDVAGARPPPWEAAPVHHVALRVADLAAAERFYHGALGLPLLRRQADVEGQPRSVWLALGHGAILMLERGARAAPGGGWHLLALRIAANGRAAAEAALAARGVAVVARTAYTLYVADPEGNRLGLSHYPDAAPSPAPPQEPAR